MLTSRGTCRKVHASIPSVADRLRRDGAEEMGRTAGVANYFRKPYGPGWALVGDTGYDRDTITAQGISDAFIDADDLAEAFDAGFSGRRCSSDALADFHEESRPAREALYHSPVSWHGWSLPRRTCSSYLARSMATGKRPEQFYAAIAGSLPLDEFMRPRISNGLLERRAECVWHRSRGEAFRPDPRSRRPPA